MEIILASSSPRRQEMLKNLGLEFEIEPAELDESLLKERPPAETVMELALAKAEKVQKNHPDALIIGADTIVFHDGVILGKPENKEQAKSMLLSLSGRSHEVFSGVAILSPIGREVFFEKTLVTFYELSDSLIERYIQTSEPLDKAGAYGIQRFGALLVKEVCGDYFNVVGLPVAKLCKKLERFGIDVMKQSLAFQYFVE